MAIRGKLVTLKEQAGEAPNGTQFMITTGPTPELDTTNLIVGKVSCTPGCTMFDRYHEMRLYLFLLSCTAWQTPLAQQQPVDA